MIRDLLILGGFVGAFVLGHEWKTRVWPWARAKLAATRLGRWFSSFGGTP